jgi:hypothetical protein
MKINTAYQEKSKEKLLTILLEKDSQLIEKDTQINSLTELVRIYRYRQFGNKSEKSSPDQINLFNEAELPKKNG